MSEPGRREWLDVSAPEGTKERLGRLCYAFDKSTGELAEEALLIGLADLEARIASEAKRIPDEKRKGKQLFRAADYPEYTRDIHNLRRQAKRWKARHK